MKLLEGWEEVFKRGQLTLWILLALKDRSKHMAEIKDFIFDATKGTLGADDKSLYRALRRFDKADMVDFKMVPSRSGPELKVYDLTETGRNVLDIFVKRNITAVFFNQNVKELLK